jgi:hypothetical protein
MEMQIAEYNLIRHLAYKNLVAIKADQTAYAVLQVAIFSEIM